MEKEIKDKIRSSLSQSERNVFHILIDLFISHFEKPAKNIHELKSRTTKMKGDIFETFCKIYLEYIGYEVYFISELPSDKLQEFGLTAKDYGIDLVIKKGDVWSCVQCKYRKPTRNSIGQNVHRVTWKDVSTFLSLATRSGPKIGWKKHIIMTNTDYVSWKGKKGSKDWTIAKKTFEGIKREDWCKMIGLEGNKLGENKEVDKEISPKELFTGKISPKELPEDKKDIRELRKRWLDRLF